LLGLFEQGFGVRHVWAPVKCFEKIENNVG